MRNFSTWMIYWLLLLGVLIAMSYAYIEYSNRNYAQNYFADKLTVEHVIASKKWHNSAFGCTYAVVQRGDSPAKPWGTGWSKTPNMAQASSDQHLPGILGCLQEASPSLYQDVTEGLKTEGSWYLRIGSEVLLYTSTRTGIALRIRYGD